jgi:hypothetical protein
MTPENAPAVEPEPAGAGEFSRITGVFFEPTKTFTEIAQRPSWVIPMLILMLAGLAATIAIGQHIGWERVIRQQDEASRQFQQLSKDQQQQALTVGMKFASAAGYAIAIAGPPLYCLIVAAVLLGITAVMSAGLRFKQVWAVVAFGSMPRAIAGILTVVVIFLKNPDDFNVQNPLAFNVGAFLDPNATPKFTYTCATALDLFTIWTILLLATGLKAAAGRKLSFTGALVAVAAPWALFTLSIAAIAGAFS